MRSDVLNKKTALGVLAAIWGLLGISDLCFSFRIIVFQQMLTKSGKPQSAHRALEWPKKSCTICKAYKSFARLPIFLSVDTLSPRAFERPPTALEWPPKSRKLPSLARDEGGAFVMENASAGTRLTPGSYCADVPIGSIGSGTAIQAKKRI